MLKKSMWYSVLAIACAGFIVLASGFYQAIIVTTMLSPQPSSEAPMTQTTEDSTLSSKNPNSVQLLILGDSVAKGTGDENSKGFSGYLPEYFKNNTSKEIIVDNAGIDGLESIGLLEQLQSQRLDKLIADSDIILVSIGGNDIRSILSLNTLAKEDEFKVRLDNYQSSLKLTFKELRNTNPNSIIIFLGLYNPYEKATSLEDARLLTTWNYNTQQLVEEDGKAIFIPTHDLLKFNVGKYIAQDGLHPNSAGYQALSNRISKSVETILTGL
ncbi:GDSL-type esterase/lipase family protein [Desulfosporosinus nitroreducens]|uniref:GDSL-type esterase/lipase family protein n=1 Tax=Desulfosporosinus nitroreducens TaxID=2018668 RepID=A0ABT8QTR4_9FIRM|nr:GDSL-type esterase/lipase family protein [Desulfosporosinus nitroreducens]MCO1602149.1 GDSL-type esterase/lipase family protein [Desulfosporosinus nitroreducens]MDO0823276.1 GDSL-type esterase/lipase family protein [Desulfosporosinus nitroreducens]